VYLLAMSIVFGAAIAIIAKLTGQASFVGGPTFRLSFTSAIGAAAAAGVASYVIFMLAASTIFQVVVKFRLWQVAANSMTISGLATLAEVRASAAPSSAVGEGLADALLGAGAI
jgi:hypothetical protein